MMTRYFKPAVILSLCALFLTACAAIKAGYVAPTTHPIELAQGKKPICTECHEPRSETVNYERFNHDVYFADSHRQASYQQRQMCSMCHATSFCNDCHATRIELKPSIKDQTGNYRRMPHRGDYLSRHLIDGRTDPISCYRCHGNPKTTVTCRRCHQ